MRRQWIIGWGLVFLLLGGSARAGQKDTCTAEVVVVAASTKPAPLPKQLAKWRPRLTKPPFSSFHGFQVLRTVQRPLSRGKKVAIALAGPYSAVITYLETVVQGKGRPQLRFRLVLRMARKHRMRILSRSTLRLDRGGTFFVAGPMLGARTLILGITLK